MIISVADFTGRLYIPNVQDAGQASFKTEFATNAAMYEKRYLETFFGYELAKLLLAAYAALPTPLDTRYANIIDGCEFTDFNGNLQKWEGLKWQGSPILPYVYYNWLRWHVTNTTLGGEVLNQIENSQQIGYTDKIVLNWNEGVKQNQILYEFLVKNSAAYPEFRAYVYNDWHNRDRKALLVPINAFNI